MLDLAAAQVAMEDLGTATARTRALASLASSVEAGEAAAVAPVKAMLRDALPATSERIAVWLADPQVSQGLRKGSYDVLKEMDPDVLAFVALNGLFTSALGQINLPTCLRNIGVGAAVERWAQLAKAADPKKLQRLVKSRTGMRNRSLPRDAKELTRLLERFGADPQDWDNDLLVAIGAPLVDAVWPCGLFELVETTGEASVVAMTEEADAALGAYDEALPWQRPRLMPMVVCPGGWEEPAKAPYLTEAQRRYLHVLGRARGRSKSVLQRAWNTQTIRPFRRALDTLSTVPFRVDLDVIEAAQWCWDRGVAVDNIPSRAASVYEAPTGLAELPEDQQRLEAQRRAEVVSLNRLNRVLGYELAKDIDAARLLGSYSAVYQPHFADYRGRLYTASSFSHHRSDHVRAAFRFARAVPLGDHGERWLMRHLANCAAGDAYGKLDKAPWVEREAWVSGNRDLVLAVADDWQTKPELWTRTDSPFAFLQACREFAAMTRWEEGAASFNSSLIVGIDATCSGLQHYAAALRAEGEGALVNLTPGERPADIYAAVAEQVAVRLHDLAAGGHDATDDDRAAARQWLDFGVSRSTVKRQVMTFAYSSEVFGFRDQISQDIMRPIKRQLLEGRLAVHPFGDDNGAWRASLVLAKAIWAALQSVVVKAAEGMKWLKSTAGLLAKHGHGVEWTTPAGFPVVHKTMRGKEKRVGFTLGVAKVMVTVETMDEKSLVTHRQRNAAAPNLIHSCDAAHLHLTTCAMVDRGVSDLAMIHDSFGTQPGNLELLATTLRETFVSMYETFDPFAAVHTFATQALPEKALKELEAPPTKGTLDIRQVLESPYVFC